MLRGTSEGLEFVFARGSFDESVAAFRRRLTERPDFYRGSAATAILDGDPPEPSAFGEFVAAVRSHGIELRGVYGDPAMEGVAAACGLSYLGSPRRPAATLLGDIERRRAARDAAALLTERARSLDADFAGARADLAARRARRSLRVAAVVQRTPAPAIDAVATRYYRGTVRGGQSLQQVGNIVVVGDVNPGAELVASGDIVVFGALRGTAHAGAQGDRAARVAAFDLTPTQLRIATCIAAGDDDRRREPEEARIEVDRIVIVPLREVRV
jgi:septum site-determining protein MinC